MYTKLFEVQADLLKALAHPRRLEIIHLLRDQELCVSDIYEMLDLPQANISQHLMILREAGIVICAKKGKHIFYRVAHSKVLQASDLLREVLAEKFVGQPIAEQFSLPMADFLPVVHDPVCNMRVSPKTASYNMEFNQEKYYFCASGCFKKFMSQPERYVYA